MNDIQREDFNKNEKNEEFDSTPPKLSELKDEPKKGGLRVVIVAVVVFGLIGLILTGLLFRKNVKKEVYETATEQQQRADEQRLDRQQKALDSSFQNLNVGEYSPAPISKQKGKSIGSTPFDVEEPPPAQGPPPVDNSVKLPEVLTQPLVDEAAAREKARMEERMAKLEQELRSQKEENERLRQEQELARQQPPPQPVTVVETKPATPPPPPRSSVYFNNTGVSTPVGAPPATNQPIPPGGDETVAAGNRPVDSPRTTLRSGGVLVKRAPFGTMIPIRLLGTVASNTLSDSYVRCEVIRDVQGRDWRIPRGTQLIGQASANSENRVFVNFIGYIDPRLNRLIKLKCQAVGQDGQNGFPAKVKHLDSRFNYVLNRLFNTATFLAQASLVRNRGFLVLPNTGDISILTGIPGIAGGAGIGMGGGSALRTYIKVQPNTEGYALVVETPEAVETIDAAGIEMTTTNIGGEGEEIRRILDDVERNDNSNQQGRRGGPFWDETPNTSRSRTGRGPAWNPQVESDFFTVSHETTEQPPCDCARLLQGPAQTQPTQGRAEDILLNAILAQAGRRSDDQKARALIRNELQAAGVLTSEVVQVWSEALLARQQQQSGADGGGQKLTAGPGGGFAHLKSYEQIMFELRQKEIGFFIFKTTLASRMQPRIVVAVLVTACAVLRFDPTVCGVLIAQVPRVINQNDRDAVNLAEYNQTMAKIKARLAEMGGGAYE